jgi:hypothetical protein
MRWKLRSCPRCGGDVFIDGDFYGWYEKCLQCGYCYKLRSLDEFGQSPARKDRKPVGTPEH